MSIDVNRLEIIRDFVKNNIEVNKSLSISSQKIRTNNALQHMHMHKFIDKDVNELYKLFLFYVDKAEMMCAGSSISMMKKFAGINLNEEVIDNNSRMSRNDVLKLLSERKISSFSCDILMSAIDLGTINSKYTVRKSNNSSSYIELTNGYVFNIKSFLEINKLIKQPKVICIDGFIESVSEIHHILVRLSENKIPCILFTRGMSDEVIHTIKVNNSRETIQLYPYCVPFDVENVNTLVDIAAACSCDVISSNKGELISSIDVNNIVSIDKATLNKSCVIITNETSKRRVHDHIQHLKLTLAERPEIASIIVQRIRSLSTSNIDIVIQDDIDFNSRSLEIDEGIRFLSSVLKGTTNRKTASDYCLNAFNEISNNAVFTS